MTKEDFYLTIELNNSCACFLKYEIEDAYEYIDAHVNELIHIYKLMLETDESVDIRTCVMLREMMREYFDSNIYDEYDVNCCLIWCVYDKSGPFFNPFEKFDELTEEAIWSKEHRHYRINVIKDIITLLESW